MKWFQAISSPFRWFITYVTHITHITYIHNLYNLHNSCNSHKSCNLHKSYNLHNPFNLHNSYFEVYFWSLLKDAFINFFSIYKNSKKAIIKNTKKDSEKKHVTDIKIFLKKKKKKGEKRPQKNIKVLLRNKQRKDVRIISNVSRSYLTHKK